MKYIFIFVISLLSFFFGSSQQVVDLCPGERNVFTYWSTFTNIDGGWIWVLNRDTVSYNNEVKITYRDTGFYLIRVQYKNDCGISTQYYRVYVRKCPESSIFFPNAFTPNNDGLNDTWSPISKKIIRIYWQIFDRYGVKVFETFSLEKTWDGRYKGVMQPMGNYVFYSTWIGRDGKVGSKKGNLLLIH